MLGSCSNLSWLRMRFRRIQLRELIFWFWPLLDYGMWCQSGCSANGRFHCRCSGGSQDTHRLSLVQRITNILEMVAYVIPLNFVNYYSDSRRTREEHGTLLCKLICRSNGIGIYSTLPTTCKLTIDLLCYLASLDVKYGTKVV